MAVGLTFVTLVATGCGSDTVALSDVDGAFDAHGVECNSFSTATRTELVSMGRDMGADQTGRLFTEAANGLPNGGGRYDLVKCGTANIALSRDEEVYVVLIVDEDLRSDLEATGVKVIGPKDVR